MLDVVRKYSGIANGTEGALHGADCSEVRSKLGCNPRKKDWLMFDDWGKAPGVEMSVNGTG